MTNAERFARAIRREPIDRLMTNDFVDNSWVLRKQGGYDPSRPQDFWDVAATNARAFRRIGLDITRFAYDSVHHWMGTKIENWIRFFGVDPANWGISVEGGTAWIARRPFRDLAGLERHMPNPPRAEEVEAWYSPFIRRAKEVFEAENRVFIGAVEGAITDAYTYADMELFMLATHDAPELVSRLLDCTGLFSAQVARAFAARPSAPLVFMGEDIACRTGPMSPVTLVGRLTEGRRRLRAEGNGANAPLGKETIEGNDGSLRDPEDGLLFDPGATRGRDFPFRMSNAFRDPIPVGRRSTFSAPARGPTIRGRLSSDALARRTEAFGVQKPTLAVGGHCGLLSL